MVETYFVVKKTAIKYTGILNVDELYLHIDEWLHSKGFDKVETKTEEHVEADGKYVELLLEPYYKFNDYCKEILRIHIHMNNIKDVDVNIDNHALKMQEGAIKIETDGFFITDYENRWESRPFYFFIRSLIDKYIYRIYNQKYETILKENANEFRANIKSFLNLYRFKVER
jgi:hypothetical protein